MLSAPAPPASNAAASAFGFARAIAASSAFASVAGFAAVGAARAATAVPPAMIGTFATEVKRAGGRRSHVPLDRTRDARSPATRTRSKCAGFQRRFAASPVGSNETRSPNAATSPRCALRIDDCTHKALGQLSLTCAFAFLAPSRVRARCQDPVLVTNENSCSRGKPDSHSSSHSQKIFFCRAPLAALTRTRLSTI